MKNYEEQFPKLCYFFAAYFHQDWDVTYIWKEQKPNFESIVRHFKAVENSKVVNSVIREMEDFLKISFTESEYRKVVNRTLGSSYYPPGIGMTYQDWLKTILHVLKESQAKELQEVGGGWKFTLDGERIY